MLYKNLLFQLEETTSDSVKAAGRGIQKSFKSVDTEALPNPGRGVTGKSESNKVTLGGKKTYSKFQ